ncbi:bifunctional 2-polyprenyl-6-hydroxyphenol methylase/3-demethylubiquinol 3-O-methyltransferase UbiG [Marinicella gelatinilytica]|uniref:bifunctional 2-polyprenyl-6-hydroxyphenol methylase/3-demethylubiquinol 3-O-methyltransferase UbiG n=1 Tax=Marinicella gelatinilytica TaxID=2996017 RepID=UPI00226089C5|nr:bifunctional 2-polyprenyl-6-hydroxyphenol methylase/3-demethylubiquinol 3-O-methyltransferase UbiG [Marinicella gelatinilytica]MCX7545606.1 bifunctional 2-polyprenyl-6-hydroxyphenol methylase/3-demethylubiquinol 3-O-methyltransferase UbiG [Marinicella gelatinilytica]
MTMEANHFPHEIEQFDQQAAFWWDADGPFKTLHHINPVRVGYMQGMVEFKDKKVLDVGCGGGVLSEALAALGAQVTGLDLAESSLQTAKLHLLESGLDVDYQNQDVATFSEANQGQFDVVCCLEMLEHVPDPKGIITSCLKALKPGGWLFLSTLNRTPKAMMLGIFAAEHVLKLIPKGTHHFEQFIKPSELVQMLKDTDTEIRDISGMRYNPMTKSAVIDGSDLNINYLMAIQKIDTTSDSQ